MNLINRFVTEDSGAETVEYALVLGLIALAAVASMQLVGGQLVIIWSSLVSSLTAAG
jgi:pilus assembly protein Flp/PilA